MKNSKEYNKTYYLKNREAKIAKTKEYNELHRDEKLKYNKLYKAKHKGEIAVRYKEFRLAAKRNDHEFELSIEQFKEIITPECIYCDGYFGKSITGSGIDRVDNSKGYIFENCVSCCPFCNKLKRDCLSFEETKLLIKTLIQYRRS